MEGHLRHELRKTKRNRIERLPGVVVAALAVSIYACGGTVRDDSAPPPPRLAVLSAFPAELAAVLEHVTIDDTVVLNDHVFRVGTLGGVPVVAGMTGIGLVNAATTTRAVIERFAVTGVVVSGVAGSPLQIGDVAVPVAWALRDGATFAAHQEWIELAKEIAAPGAVTLERCTLVPTASTEPVCMLTEPAVVVGGVGQSTDPFSGKPFPCQPGAGDLYGCDVTSAQTAADDPGAMGTSSAVDAEPPAVNDMETAAIGREATMSGIPFIAFRAVSDGAGDPLGLHGFFAQFAVYYRFAAHNAAAATAAFIERLAAVTR